MGLDAKGDDVTKEPGNRLLAFCVTLTTLDSRHVA
jgi:hypothetical protein